jgi:hypothetical protein
MIRKLGIAVLLWLTGMRGAIAADPLIDVFGGVSVAPYSVFAYLGGVAPMNGNLTADGFLTRIAGGVGGYSYQTLPGVRQAVSQQLGDAMLGYQLHFHGARFSAYAGIEMQNHENADRAALIRGASIGAKGQLEVYSPVGERFFGFALGSLSSNYRSYYAKAKVGYRITQDISFGPEGMAQGNTEFDQTSVGGAFGFKLLGADFYLSGGYLWDLRSRGGGGPDTNGLYGQAGVSRRF